MNKDITKEQFKKWCRDWGIKKYLKETKDIKVFTPTIINLKTNEFKHIKLPNL